jgi:hypothetical protein
MAEDQKRGPLDKPFDFGLDNLGRYCRRIRQPEVQMNALRCPSGLDSAIGIAYRKHNHAIGRWEKAPGTKRAANCRDIFGMRWTANL